MSMRDYPVILDAAFLIDPEVAAYISLAEDKKKDCVPESVAKLSWEDFVKLARSEDLPEEYYDLQIADVIPNEIFVSWFGGKVISLFPDLTKCPIDEEYNEGDIYYIPAEKAADLFSAAYASQDELLNEFKNVFATNGIILPVDFDWWGHIVKIEGTTFG